MVAPVTEASAVEGKSVAQGSTPVKAPRAVTQAAQTTRLANAAASGSGTKSSSSSSSPSLFPFSSSSPPFRPSLLPPSRVARVLVDDEESNGGLFRFFGGEVEKRKIKIKFKRGCSSLPSSILPRRRKALEKLGFQASSGPATQRKIESAVCTSTVEEQKNTNLEEPAGRRRICVCRRCRAFLLSDADATAAAAAADNDDVKALGTAAPRGPRTGRASHADGERTGIMVLRVACKPESRKTGRDVKKRTDALQQAEKKLLYSGVLSHSPTRQPRKKKLCSLSLSLPLPKPPWPLPRSRFVFDVL